MNEKRWIAVHSSSIAPGWVHVTCFSYIGGIARFTGATLSLSADEWTMFQADLGETLIVVPREKAPQIHPPGPWQPPPGVSAATSASKPQQSAKETNRKAAPPPKTAAPAAKSVEDPQGSPKSATPGATTRKPRDPELCERSGYWRDALAGKNPPIHEGAPQPGYYKRKLVVGGPWVPVRVWISQKIDEAGDLVSDPVWSMLVGDSLNTNHDYIASQWERFGARPISEEDWNYMADTARYAAHVDRSLPEANPKQPVDLNKAAPILPE